MNLTDVDSNFKAEADVPARLLISMSQSCMLTEKAGPSRADVAIAVRPSREGGKDEQMHDI